MSMPHIRVSLKSALFAVAIAAGMLAIIRHVERSIHRAEVASWVEREENWREASADALEVGDAIAAAEHKRLEAACMLGRKSEERQLVGFPRTLSASSVFWAQIYLWLVTLGLVLRAESKSGGQSIWRRFDPRPIPDIQWIRSRTQPFNVWFALVLADPIALVVVGVMFAVPTAYPGDTSLGSGLVTALLWAQITIVQLGVVFVRGKRLPVLGLGVLAMLATGFIGLYSAMSVSGVWL